MEAKSVLSGKKLLLGVTGSIAAYKAVEVLRRLTEQGAEVRVVMTRHAARFVAPLTFETLSGRPVLIDEFEAGGSAIGHIEAARGLDAALIAPATANCIGKIAAGIADDALTSAVLALACPLLLAPAMNDRMYANAVVQRNIASLRSLGVRFVEPDAGQLACGTVGPGRLAESDRIVAAVVALFPDRDLAGRTVLVTAGPTREPIDAVRFISNPSTGKMGYAIAEAAAERGARVILVTGPTQLAPPPGVSIRAVVTARDMHREVLQAAPSSDIVIMAAAVSDFRPAASAAGKIKKDAASLSIPLVPNPDILKELGAAGHQQVLVGFAAETDSVEAHALAKLTAKNLDLIVANDLTSPGSGFGSDTNSVVIYDRSGGKRELPLQSKKDIARAVVSAAASLLKP